MQPTDRIKGCVVDREASNMIVAAKELQTQTGSEDLSAVWLKYCRN